MPDGGGRGRTASKPHVLYVDDEPQNLAAFKYEFVDDFDISTVGSGAEALDLLAQEPIDVIIADQRMPGMVGTVLLEKVRHRYPNVMRMVVTGYGDIDAVVAAVNQAAVFSYFTKPWTGSQIRLAVSNAFETIRLNRSLEESERRFRETFERAALGIVHFDPDDGKLLRVNQQFCDVLGRTPDEIQQMTWAEVTDHNGELAGDLCPEKLLDGVVETCSVEQPLLRRDGTQVWCETRLSLARTTDGDPAFVIATVQDISGRRRSHAAVARLKERLELAARAAHLGIWDWDVQTNEFVWDDGMHALYGLAPADLDSSQEPWRISLYPDDGAQVEADVQTALRGEQDFDRSFRIAGASGEVRHIHATAAVFRDADGAPVRMVGVNRDVTSEKEQEEAIRVLNQDLEEKVQRRTEELAAANVALEQREQQYKALVETTNDWVWEVDAGGHYTYASPQCHQLLGFSPEEVLGKTMLDLMPADEAERVGAVFAAIVESRGPFTGLLKANQHKDGRLVVMETNGVPIFGHDDVLLGFRGIDRDVTERERVEATRRLTQFAIDHAGDAAYWLRADDGRFQYVNKMACASLRYSREELLNKAVFDISPALTAEEWPAFVERLKRRRRVNFEAEHLRADGTVFPVEITANLTTFEGTDYFVAFARDITERRVAEATLRKLSRAIEASPVVVIITDRNGTIEYVNPKFSEITGFAVREAIGARPNLLKSDEHPPVFYEELWEKILAGEEWHGEFCNRKKNGELFWESASISPVRNGENEITHFVAVKEDITARKQAEAELRAAKEQAEVASRTKSGFLASMSHELRTPLNAIIGFSEILHDGAFGALNSKQGRYVDHVLTSARHLLVLINDILDLAKVEAGKEELSLSQFELASVLERSLTMVTERASRGGIDLRLNIPEEARGRELVADERKVMQVMFNLLSNAVKFTPAGGQVSVSVEWDGAMVLVSVRDTGIGIAPVDQARVFSQFEQVDSSLSRRHQGTGLGLALCQTYVTMHGGLIWVESAGEMQGSQFTFALPVVGPPG